MELPVRAIREVLDPEGLPLRRVGLEVLRALDPKTAYLLKFALTKVVEEGTGMPLRDLLPEVSPLAGKTGTTDDLRDSWFAGFSEDRMAVVWLGRDDNQSVHLTGAAGAMRVWAAILRRSGGRGLRMKPPPGIDFREVRVETGLDAGSRCVRLPFVAGVVARDVVGCGGVGAAADAGGAAVKTVAPSPPVR
jgi:penicillin-binding protein 1B